MPAPPQRWRPSLRLAAYDYRTAGAYFVTIVTHRRACLFGDIREDAMRRNEYGDIVQATWEELPARYPGVELDAFVVMPNHVHGVIVTNGQVALGPLVRAFKALVTRKIRIQRGPGDVWQSSFHDHIVRSDEELETIRRYIEENPLKWSLDQENPSAAPA